MTFDILPFPRSRELLIDSFQMAAKRHIIHGFLEVDVTVPRRILKVTLGTDGHPLSFTGFVIASFARAIYTHQTVQAYRDWRNRLIVFHDVDVSTVVEPSPDAQPIPHIIRDANTRSVRKSVRKYGLSKPIPSRGPFLNEASPWQPVFRVSSEFCSFAV